MNNEDIKKENEELLSDSPALKEDDAPLDKNIKLMSPGRMVLRRFFRSRLSLLGLTMLVVLFIFCWLGPVIYNRWGETAQDKSGKIEYAHEKVTYESNGETFTFYQVEERGLEINMLARPSADHILGTEL